MKPIGLKTETKLFNSGHSIIVGCDEVGRGALAGPIVAAAVAISTKSLVPSAKLGRAKKDWWGNKVNDSKLLTAREREELAIHIKHFSVAFGVASISPSKIDKINIHEANLLALHLAVEKLHMQLSSKVRNNTYVLVDGKFILPNWQGEQRAVVDGDAKIFSIAVASIIAKTFRDRYMMKQDKKFPKFGFAKHKGYGTLEHRTALVRNGLSKIHRQTFCRNIDAWARKTV